MSDNPNNPRLPGVIKSDPGIMGGAPCFAGTRIPVSVVLSCFSGGYTTEQILADYESVTMADIEAAQRFREERKPSEAISRARADFKQAFGVDPIDLLRGNKEALQRVKDLCAQTKATPPELERQGMITATELAQMLLRKKGINVAISPEVVDALRSPSPDVPYVTDEQLRNYTELLRHEPGLHQVNAVNQRNGAPRFTREEIQETLTDMDLTIKPMTPEALEEYRKLNEEMRPSRERAMRVTAVSPEVASTLRQIDALKEQIAAQPPLSEPVRQEMEQQFVAETISHGRHLDGETKTGTDGSTPNSGPKGPPPGEA